YWWMKVRSFSPCPKRSGLQLSKGLCFEHHTGCCTGACTGAETAHDYNMRCLEAIESFAARPGSLAIIGKGRHAREQSLVLVEQGKYLGFGFLDRKAPVDDLTFVRSAISPGVETPVVRSEERRVGKESEVR